MLRMPVFERMPGRGYTASQAGMRAYNERLVLSLVRRRDGLSKAEIARRIGLSAQTVSVIMRSLERDGLLERGSPVKGRVGQPYVPMSLARHGAYAIGLKIGRRSAELVLIDFIGNIQETRRQIYAYPLADTILDFATEAIACLLQSLSSEQRTRVAGLGIAIPYELWNWPAQVGAPPSEVAKWRGFDLPGVLSTRFDLPVYVQNDATAACGAELFFGRGKDASDFVYFYVGSFVGGGLVVNGAVFAGKSGNAGALGSMPVAMGLAAGGGTSGQPRQLIEQASLFLLEQAVQSAGKDASALWRRPECWDGYGGLVEAWTERAARALAYAVAASCSVIDFPHAVIDGVMPVDVRTRLTAAVKRELAHIDTQGIAEPAIVEGMVGPAARTLGGAVLPLSARYMVDMSVLIK